MVKLEFGLGLQLRQHPHSPPSIVILQPMLATTTTTTTTATNTTPATGIDLSTLHGWICTTLSTPSRAHPRLPLTVATRVAGTRDRVSVRVESDRVYAKKLNGVGVYERLSNEPLSLSLCALARSFTHFLHCRTPALPRSLAPSPIRPTLAS